MATAPITPEVKSAAQGTVVNVNRIWASLTGFLSSGIVATIGGIATTFMPTTSATILAALVAIGALVSAIGHMLVVVGVIKSTNDNTYRTIENLLNELSTALGGKKVVDDLPPTPAPQA